MDAFFHLFKSGKSLNPVPIGPSVLRSPVKREVIYTFCSATISADDVKVDTMVDAVQLAIPQNSHECSANELLEFFQYRKPFLLCGKPFPFQNAPPFLI
jgi:hypothetical protein